MNEAVGVVLNKSSWSLSGLAESQGMGLIFTIIVLFGILLRILCILRVAKDSMARNHSLGSQILSVLIVTILSPIIGLPIYLAIRPIGYRRDRLPRREAGVMNLIVCYNCGTLNPKDHECCLACGEALKVKCKQCGKNFAHSYGYCSYCGAPNIE